MGLEEDPGGTQKKQSLTRMSHYKVRVNEAKTEVCLFSRSDIPTITITVNRDNIETKNQMNVLGIIFDSKLQWGPQVSATLAKSKKAFYLNGKIDLDWLNLSFDSYKLKCKVKFL